MTDRTTWMALAERCETAKGSDEELDVAIVMAAYPDIGPPNALCVGDDPIFWHEPYRKQYPPLLTASLDAITALIEREFPGRGWNIESPGDDWPNEPSRATIIIEVRETPEGPEALEGSGAAATPALALCAAFCRAMAKKSSP